jgi:uncharacterized membrane protein YeaQ/YmgE (transglycosylase-associated protein family)
MGYGQSKYEGLMTEAQILWLAIGGLAGWLAGVLMKGSGYGLAGDIIIGIVGGFIGGWLAEILGLEVAGDIVPSIVTAVFGAAIFISVMRMFAKAA